MFDFHISGESKLTWQSNIFSDFYHVFSDLLITLQFPIIFPNNLTDFFSFFYPSIYKSKSLYIFDVMYYFKTDKIILEINSKLFLVNVEFFLDSCNPLQIVNISTTILPMGEFDFKPDNYYYGAISKIIHKHEPSHQIFQKFSPNMPIWFADENIHLVGLDYMTKLFEKLGFVFVSNVYTSFYAWDKDDYTIGFDGEKFQCVWGDVPESIDRSLIEIISFVKVNVLGDY